jgi:hypothetical protein
MNWNFGKWSIFVYYADVTPPFVEFQESANISGEGLLSLAGNESSEFLRTQLQTMDGYLVAPWVVMLQAINHATEHREQIKSMLSFLGWSNCNSACVLERRGGRVHLPLRTVPGIQDPLLIETAGDQRYTILIFSLMPATAANTAARGHFLIAGPAGGHTIAR